MHVEGILRKDGRMASFVDVAVVAVSGAIGFLSAVFAGPLRNRLFRAQVQLDYSGDEDCVSRTTEWVRSVPDEPESDYGREAIYLRVRVRNKKKIIAKSCRAYLVNIEKDNGNGIFKRTIYTESIPLAWSCRGSDRFSEMDIPYGITQYIDVLKKHDEQDFVHLQLSVLPNRYISILHKSGRYRLTIQVAGDGVIPASLGLIFDWKGKWDTFDALSDQ